MTNFAAGDTSVGSTPTTAVYTTAAGLQARDFLSRMWATPT